LYIQEEQSTGQTLWVVWEVEDVCGEKTVDVEEKHVSAKIQIG
jgi:hypothetical protein